VTLIKNMRKSFCLIILTLFVPALLFGQPEVLTTKDKKAKEDYLKAQKLYDSRQSKQASILLFDAIKHDPSFIEAHILLGYVYEDMGDRQGAIAETKLALNINPHYFKGLYFTLAQLQLFIGNYAESLQNYETYLLNPIDDPKMEFSTKMGIEDCKFAIEALKHPVPFDPKNMGININGQYSEYFPTITADGSTFLFTRRIPDNSNPLNMSGTQEDFYVSYKINGEWTKALNVGPPLNTMYNEGASTLSADGNLLVYTRCECRECGFSIGYGSCDLFYSYRMGNTWSTPKDIGRPINTPNWESQPSLSSDGRTLYFVRGIEYGTTIKQADIYVTQLSDSGRWSNPIKLSDTINTPGNEESPFIAPDDQTLYFASDGHPGMGGLDIYVSRRLPNGRWGIPKNLGYPINTFNDETGMIIDPNGHTAYFSSDRDDTYGGLDFYSFELYDSARPQPITYVKGKVYDAKTEIPLVAAFNLIDLATGKPVVQSSSAPVTGTFLVCLTLNKDYALNVSRPGYLFYSENFSLKNIAASAAHPFMMDVPLQPIDTGATIILKNIFFATDSFALKPESHIELNKLVTFLNANPAVKIQVSGHTDNTGTVEHNKALSTNRAKSVYTYLSEHGISADRLSYKGYGQSRPIADNNTEAGKAKNRRTEMKIVAK
jgi:outer membrane protein OmpA-like peptidoglycan-associated protein